MRWPESETNLRWLGPAGLVPVALVLLGNCSARRRERRPRTRRWPAADQSRAANPACRARTCDSCSGCVVKTRQTTTESTKTVERCMNHLQHTPHCINRSFSTVQYFLLWQQHFPCHGHLSLVSELLRENQFWLTAFSSLFYWMIWGIHLAWKKQLHDDFSVKTEKFNKHWCREALTSTRKYPLKGRNRNHK